MACVPSWLIYSMNASLTSVYEHSAKRRACETPSSPTPVSTDFMGFPPLCQPPNREERMRRRPAAENVRDVVDPGLECAFYTRGRLALHGLTRTGELPDCWARRSLATG